jgi:hypothetical protein
MSPQSERRWEVVWRALTVIGVIFLAGVAFSGYVKMPGQLHTMQLTVDSFRVDHAIIYHNIGDIERAQRDILCLMLAEKEGRNWISCSVKVTPP